MQRILLVTAIPIALQHALLLPLVAQAPRPAARELLKTGAEWVSGVAEPASGRFLVYSDDHEIKIYNRKTQKTTSVAVKVHVATLGGTLSISRSGGRLIFPADDDAKGTTYIWSLDLDTLTGTPLGAARRVSVVPARMSSISPDGRWIALTSNDSNAVGWGAGDRLLVIPSAGGEERVLDSGPRVRTPRWSPDGQSIFYARGLALRRINITVGTSDSLGLATIVLGVSPDSKHLAFYSEERGVQISDLRGAVVRAFDGFEGFDRPRPYGWAQSGGIRILGYHQPSPAMLKTVSLADGSNAPYGVSEPFPVGARLSPDGSRLAMTTEIAGRRQFVVHDMKSRQRRVLPTEREPQGPWKWSPDGLHIAFLNNSATTNRIDLNVIHVETGKVLRFTELFTTNEAGHRSFLRADWHYGWHSDSRSIDYVGDAIPGRPAVDVRRVTLSGVRSVVRALPTSDGADHFLFVSDSLLLIARRNETGLLAVPLPGGEPRTLVASEPFSVFNLSYRHNPVSPDGKWVAIGTARNTAKKPQWAIVSLDGKEFRLLGSVMQCDVWAGQWLPDSRGFIGEGASTCDPWNPELFVVPIDGGPARRIALPANQERGNGGVFQLTPDGKRVLFAADEVKIGRIVEFDFGPILGASKASGAGKR